MYRETLRRGERKRSRGERKGEKERGRKRKKERKIGKRSLCTKRQNKGERVCVCVCACVRKVIKGG